MKKMKCILILIIISITFPYLGKGYAYNSQIVDKDSAITIRTDKKTYFSVQLFSRFTKDGLHNKFLLIERNKKTIANINFPSSEDIKNFSVNMKKHKKGFILECFYGALIPQHFDLTLFIST